MHPTWGKSAHSLKRQDCWSILYLLVLCLVRFPHFLWEAVWESCQLPCYGMLPDFKAFPLLNCIQLLIISYNYLDQTKYSLWCFLRLVPSPLCHHLPQLFILLSFVHVEPVCLGNRFSNIPFLPGDSAAAVEEKGWSLLSLTLCTLKCDIWKGDSVQGMQWIPLPLLWTGLFIHLFWGGGWIFCPKMAIVYLTLSVYWSQSPLTETNFHWSS